MTFAGRIARERPDEIAVRDRTEAITWSEADERLRGAATALQKCQLDGARRVAVLAGNSVNTLLAYTASTLAGASAVAVNAHLTAAETAFILNDSQAAVVLCDTTTVAVATEAARQANVDTVVAWGEGELPPGVQGWSTWRGDSTEPRTDVAPRRTVVYTSGTTGRPKGVELPPSSWAGGNDIEEHLAALRANHLVKYGRHLVVGPLYHSGPLASTRLFAAGVAISLLQKFDAEELLQSIERDRIGSTIMVPTHFQRLLALPQERRHAADTSSLRYVLQVGAKCPTAVKRAMIDWFGPIIWESYGASEVGTTCMISPTEWLQRPGSVGRAIPPFTAFIKGEDGKKAPANTEGALWFRDSSGRGFTYLTGVHSGAEFTLGEIGHMDEQGYVWITDRLSDMVVSGGVNIYPAEVEQALQRYPEVAEAACFGLPHEDLGEKLVAVVVPRDPAHPPSANELSSFARNHLAGYKIPKEFHIAQALIHSALGKIDKRAMRRLYAGDASAPHPTDSEVSPMP